MSLMTNGVMSSLIGAASQVQLARTPNAIYRQEAAKLKPNQAVLENAAKYGSDTLAAASEETKKAAEALEKAQMEATAQEKAQEAAQLGQAGTEESSKTPQVSGENTIKQPVDTVEISAEGKAATSKPPDTPAPDAPAQAVVAGDTPKVYTATGTVVAVAVPVQPTISAKA